MHTKSYEYSRKLQISNSGPPGQLTVCDLAADTPRTVLVHAVAACLILLLDESHRTDSLSVVKATTTVRETLVILHDLADFSIIAKKGYLVISPLIEDSAQLTDACSVVTVKDRNDFLGRTEGELKRALDMFRRGDQDVGPPPAPASAFEPYRAAGAATAQTLGAMVGTGGGELLVPPFRPAAAGTHLEPGALAEVWDPFLWTSQVNLESLELDLDAVDWDNF